MTLLIDVCVNTVEIRESSYFFLFIKRHILDGRFNEKNILSVIFENRNSNFATISF